jgi:hypothetical protein
VRDGRVEVCLVLPAGVLGLEQQDQLLPVAGSRSHVWYLAASTSGVTSSQIRPLPAPSKTYPVQRSRTRGKLAAGIAQRLVTSA